MAKSKDLRVQTTVVGTPAVGVVSVYADTSGVLSLVNENGTIYPVGQQWSGNVVGAQFSPVVSMGVSGALTGAVYFLPIIGPSGQNLMIPAWKRP